MLCNERLLEFAREELCASSEETCSYKALERAEVEHYSMISYAHLGIFSHKIHRREETYGQTETEKHRQ